MEEIDLGGGVCLCTSGTELRGMQFWILRATFLQVGVVVTTKGSFESMFGCRGSRKVPQVAGSECSGVAGGVAELSVGASG